MPRAVLAARIAAALLVAGLGVARAADAEGGGLAWHRGPLAAALADGAKAQKVVLFDAWAAWCKYCHEMDRTVWNKDEVARALEREVVPFRAEVDVLKGVGLDLKNRFGIDGLPVVLLIDPRDGTEVLRLEGYHDARSVLEAVDKARLRVYPTRATEGAADDDSAALVRAAGQLFRAGSLDAAAETARRAVAADASCAKDDADDAALLLADVAAQRHDDEGEVAALRAAAASCANATGAAEIWDRLIEVSSRVEGEAGRGRLLTERADLYPGDGVAALAAGRWLLRESKQTELATKYAERALAADPASAPAMGLMAEIEAERGQYDAALALVERAIKIDPHDPALREARLRITLALRQQRP